MTNKQLFSTVLLAAFSFLVSAQEKGKLYVDCNQAGATVWVDGQKQGMVPLTLELSGQHNIRVENDINHFYRSTDLVNFTPGMDESRTYTLKAMPPKCYGFAMLQYGFSANEVGIMLGICRSWGGYFRAATTIRSSSAGKLDSTPKYYNAVPIRKLKDPYSMSVAAGVMYRITPYLYAFLGAGYAECSPGIYPDDDTSVGREMVGSNYYGTQLAGRRPNDDANGWIADLGVIAKWKALLLSIGYSRCVVKGSNFRQGDQYGNVRIGLGVTLHKNIKR